jgi:hypothetical protein
MNHRIRERSMRVAVFANALRPNPNQVPVEGLARHPQWWMPGKPEDVLRIDDLPIPDARATSGGSYSPSGLN